MYLILYSSQGYEVHYTLNIQLNKLHYILIITINKKRRKEKVGKGPGVQASDETF